LKLYDPLSQYASFPGIQAQHKESGCNEAIISALRETQYDQLVEEREAVIHLPSPVELDPPSAVGPKNETTNLTTSLPLKRQTRSVSRMAGYVIPNILEPQFDENSEQEGGLT
jgi:hypothetical protein